MPLQEHNSTHNSRESFVLNYAPGVASDGKFHGKYLLYSIYQTPAFSVCVHESLWSAWFMGHYFLGGRSRNTKDSLELCVELCSRRRIWQKNSKVSTFATQFIWRLCFPYVYVSPYEAHVLRLSIFLDEDRETQNIPLNYALNYARGVASKRKFNGKYLCVHEVLWSPCLMARHFLGGWSRNTKDSLELCVELCSRSNIWRKIPW